MKNMTEMRILKLLLPTTGNMKEEEQWKQNFKNLFSFFFKKNLWSKIFSEQNLWKTGKNYCTLKAVWIVYGGGRFIHLACSICACQVWWNPFLSWLLSWTRLDYSQLDATQSCHEKFKKGDTCLEGKFHYHDSRIFFISKLHL